MSLKRTRRFIDFIRLATVSVLLVLSVPSKANAETALIDTLYGWLGGVGAKSTTTRVVDGKTGKPVAGAVVLSTWSVKGFFGNVSKIEYLAESITDKEGYFVVPEWGPKISFSATTAYDKSPSVRVFKAGYSIKAATEQIGSREVSRINLSSSLDNKQIALEPAETSDNYREAVIRHVYLVSSLAVQYDESTCLVDLLPLHAEAFTESMKIFQNLEGSSSRFELPKDWQACDE